jgi:hypothetical protein
MAYDYIIIGGGPTGLTLALHLSELGRKCLLVDKNSSLGGCHRVTRQDDYFTEHGPRVYSSAYVNAKEILKMIGTSWDDCFVPYRFNIADIQGQTFSSLNFREKFLLGMEFFALCLGVNKKHTSIGEFMDKHKFSDNSKDYIDRICRLTDGAGSDRYTLFQFLQLFNQNVFNKLYQPSRPNDKGMFKIWEEKLKRNGVDIAKDCDVVQIQDKMVVTNIGVFVGERILITVPPKPFLQLSTVSTVGGKSLYDIWSRETGVDVAVWATEMSYIIDIPISFHWSEKVDLEKVWGFPRDDWGIAFVVLTHYMSPEPMSKLLISTCITRVNAKSTVTGKTAMESTEKEMVDEVFRQLKLSFPNLPDFNKAIVHKKTLQEEDTAYVETNKQYHMPMSTGDSAHIYYIGTHNGNTYYSFTSMESAVTNALFALRQLEPDTFFEIKKDEKTAQNVVYLLFFVVLAVILYTLSRKVRVSN